MARSRWTYILAISLGVTATPAAAQDEDYERIVTIMRACAQIDDVMARVTCYDNNIGQRPATRVSSPAPSRSEEAGPTGFGAEMVPQTRAQRSEGRQDTLSTRVTEVSEIEPDIYLVTLAGGAQWRFVDNAPVGYQPPRAGDSVALERGSLGSVFLEYEGQRRLRVRRVR